MRTVVLIVVATCVVAACSSDEPSATAGQYCATVSASLAELNAPAIADSAGIEQTAQLYRTITSIAPLAVQKEWQTIRGVKLTKLSPSLFSIEIPVAKEVGQ